MVFTSIITTYKKEARRTSSFINWDSFGRESGIITGDNDSDTDGMATPTPLRRRFRDDDSSSPGKRGHEDAKKSDGRSSDRMASSLIQQRSSSESDPGIQYHQVFDCLKRKLITWEKPNKDIKLGERYRLYYKQSQQRQALVRAITWATPPTVDEFPEHLRLEYEGKVWSDYFGFLDDSERLFLSKFQPGENGRRRRTVKYCFCK